jgi:hypothetical protein
LGRSIFQQQKPVKGLRVTLEGEGAVLFATTMYMYTHILTVLLLLLLAGWLQDDIPELRVGMAMDMLEGALGW